MSSGRVKTDRKRGNGGIAKRVAGQRRAPLNRDRVLRAGVALADEAGIEALSMRNLAQDLGVVPMALYKHVANKEELLDGMVDVIVGEIDQTMDGSDWKDAIRQRILAARQVLLRHRLGVSCDRDSHKRLADHPGLHELLDWDVPGRRLFG